MSLGKTHGKEIGRSMKHRKFIIACVLSLSYISFCGLFCNSANDGVINDADCIDFFHYDISIPPNADSIHVQGFYKDSLLFENLGHPLNYKLRNDYWGPVYRTNIFDTLSIKMVIFCSNGKYESRDYKFLNREDAFTHIDYKEQEDGELMFDAELDSICPGLSNYRITQHTDSECLEDLSYSDPS